MFSHGRHLTVVLLFGTICALLLNAGCNFSEEGRAKELPASTNNTWVIGAAGSTFIAPLMDHWASSYAQAHAVRVNYRPIGSGGGIDEIKQGRLDFAASDAPISDDQLKDMPALVQVPATAGPVCIIYNLPNLNAPLRLSAKTLAGIYSGAIVTWQDPAIARDNPGVKASQGSSHRSASFRWQWNHQYSDQLSQQGQPRLVMEIGSRAVRHLAYRSWSRGQQRGAGASQTDAGDNRLSGTELCQGERRARRFDSEPGGAVRGAESIQRRRRDQRFQRCIDQRC